MSMILSGTTAADYGNPTKQQTLAGATLVFYAHEPAPVAAATAAAPRARWDFYPTSADPTTPELGRAVVAADGTFSTTLKGRPAAVVVTIAVDKFAYAPATGKHARGVLGVAAVAALDPDGQQVRAHLAIALAKPGYCRLLAALDLWLAAGRVVAGSPAAAVAGVFVTAFDRDITQDDQLGEAETDATGSFEVFFAGAAFRKLPLLSGVLASLTSLELVGGPDLFFKVRAGAVVLLDEAPATGRASGRENSHNCSFNELTVAAPGVVPGVDAGPTVWRAIGDLAIVPATPGGVIDLDADGLTAVGKQAVHAVIKLKGTAFRRFTNGEAIRYRWLVREWANPTVAAGGPGAPPVPAGRTADPSGAVPTGWTAITAGLGGSYGSVIGFSTAGGVYTVTAVALPVAPDANGWIEVDQRVLAPGEYYAASGELARLDTAQLVPPGGYAHRKFSLVLQVQTASAGFQQAPQPIHICNDQVRLTFHLSGLGGGCDPFVRVGGTVDIDAAYQVEHPYLQSFRTYVQKHDGTNHQALSASATFAPAAPFWLAPPGISGTATLAGYGVEPCSYEAGIVAQARLTTGEATILAAGPVKEGFCVR
ncbi:MAG: hypothetical protein R3B06_09300 [Kofleriaceae bacterium]